MSINFSGIVTPFSFLDGIVTQYAPKLQEPIMHFAQFVGGFCAMFLTVWMVSKCYSMLSGGGGNDSFSELISDTGKKWVLCVLAVGSTFASPYIVAVPQTSETLAEKLAGSSQNTAWEAFDSILVNNVMDIGTILGVGLLPENILDAMEENANQNELLKKELEKRGKAKEEFDDFCNKSGVNLLKLHGTADSETTLNDIKKYMETSIKNKYPELAKTMSPTQAVEVCIFTQKDILSDEKKKEFFGTGTLDFLRNLLAHFSIVLGKILISGVTLFFGGAVFILVAMNKLFLIVCLSLAPFAIFAKAWPPTSSYFSAWMNNALGYCFSYPIIYFIITLAIKFYSQVEAGVNKYAMGGIVYVLAALGVAVMASMFRGLITKVGDVVSSVFSGRNESDGATSYAMANLSSNKRMAQSVWNMTGGKALGMAGGALGGLWNMGKSALTTLGGLAGGAALVSGGLGSLATAGIWSVAAAAAGAAGYGVGWLGRKLDEGLSGGVLSGWMGSSIANGLLRTQAFFGSDSAQAMLDAKNYADQHYGGFNYGNKEDRWFGNGK